MLYVAAADAVDKGDGLGLAPVGGEDLALGWAGVRRQTLEL